MQFNTGHLHYAPQPTYAIHNQNTKTRWRIPMLYLTIILMLASLGFLLSLYAYRVEKKILTDPHYKPFCDLSDMISCTKPLTSPYAKLFYISNSIAGMMYYALIALLALLPMSHLNLPNLHIPTLLVIVSFGGALASIILAYLLYVKIKSLCLICTSLYLINFLILAYALFTYYR